MMNCVAFVRAPRELARMHMRLVHDPAMVAVKQEQPDLLLLGQLFLNQRNQLPQVNVAQDSELLAGARHQEQDRQGAAPAVGAQLGVQVVELLAGDPALDCDLELHAAFADEHVRASAHDAGSALLVAEGASSLAQQVCDPHVAVLKDVSQDVLVVVQEV